MISSEGIAKLKAWRRRQAFICCGLGLVTAVAILSIGLALWAGSPIYVPAFFIFMLGLACSPSSVRSAPWAYMRASKDLKCQTYMQTQGPVEVVRAHPSPLANYVLVRGRKLFMAFNDEAKIQNGQTYDFIHGLASGFVVDIKHSLCQGVSNQ